MIKNSGKLFLLVVEIQLHWQCPVFLHHNPEILLGNLMIYMQTINKNILMKTIGELKHNFQNKILKTFNKIYLNIYILNTYINATIKY